MNNIYMQAALALTAGDVAVLQGELNGNTAAVLESTPPNTGGKVSRACKKRLSLKFVDGKDTAVEGCNTD